MSGSVTVEDLGIGSLVEDSERLLKAVLDEMAEVVAQRIRAGLAARGSRYGAGKAAGSVVTGKSRGGKARGELGRDIGIQAFYAWWLEFGWVQVVAWGRRLKEAIHHPGTHVARDALESVSGEFEERIGAAMQRLGK